MHNNYYYNYECLFAPEKNLKPVEMQELGGQKCYPTIHNYNLVCGCLAIIIIIIKTPTHKVVIVYSWIALFISQKLV